MIQRFIYFLCIAFCAVFICSCSISKKLPAGTQLYKGAIYTIEKDKSNKTSARSIKKELKRITAPTPNKTILGFPLRVWLWYAVGEPKKQKGFKFWLRNKLGEAPVLSTVVNTKSSAMGFESYLQNRGYFKTNASGDTSIKGYKVTAKYKINLGLPYTINDVKWVLDSSTNITTDIYRLPPKETYIVKNKQYDLGNIKAERSRTDLHLKTLGYYYFSPDYVIALVDSTIGGNKVNVYLKLKNEMPRVAKVPQTIRRITLFPNYTLLSPPPDTSRKNMQMVKNIFIRDTIREVKGTALVRSVTYQPGDLYNIKDQNKTLNRFINMGLYKFVKNRYEGNKDTANLKYLDVYYYLTPLKKKSVNAEIGSFSKSNSFTGGQLNISWKNRNTFGGAEQLVTKAYTAFEYSLNDSLQKNNNFRIGGEVSLLFPRYVLPFKLSESNYFPPKTRFTLAYEWLRRQNLFTKNFLRFQYDITWKETANKEHTVGPVSVTYSNLTNATPEYLTQLAILPSLQLANLPEILLGSFYNFTYNTINPNADNIYYFTGSLDVAGNLAGLTNKATAPYTKKIAGAFFAQYAKLDADFRYTRKLATDVYLANRFQVGIGLPYGNSAFLPFSRQFIIGGTNSLRGFRPRQIGPGRVITSAIQQVYLPQVGGDIKLEVNSELRFPIFSKVKGAVFVDLGNIWMRDSTLYGPSSVFTKTFMKDIAVNAGVGLRVDISVLVLRFDFAIPLRKPYLPMGNEWVVKDIAPFDKQWRSDNLIFNIGLGYPF